MAERVVRQLRQIQGRMAYASLWNRHRTERQYRKLTALMLLDCFTVQEADRVFAWLNTPAATVSACSIMIGRSLDRLDGQS